MRKISFSLLGLVLLATACQKNEKMLAETVADETTEAPARKCASQEILELQLQADPQRARNLEELERHTANFAGRPGLRTAGKLYIPVVVNVVLPNATQVSDAQIQSQLTALNADYNAANAELSSSSVYLAGYSYGSVANCQIEFYIQDPAADINRKSTSSPASFGTTDAVKKTSQGGLNPESPTTKLNLWVCDLSSGLLGYAQFPGGSSATDGVVIDYQAFGTSASYAMYAQFNKGRTATHEIGHWLNLRHIWGDRRCGDDLVGDTPQHDDSNGGCPSTSHTSKCPGRPLEQWMNYMDYTDDACMYMFSAGQKTRMDAAIDGNRGAYTRTTK